MVTEWSKLVRFLIRGKTRVKVDEELDFHIEQQTQANLAAGMPLEEARRQATIAFGSLEQARDGCHEQRPIWFFESLLRDARYGVRGLGRNPAFAVVAVMTLALAIGANTAIFSLLNQALLRALPVRSPDQLVVLSFAGSQTGHIHDGGGNFPGHQHYFSYPMYRDLRDKSAVFQGLIAARTGSAGVYWNNRAEATPIEMVTGNYFDVLGVRAAIGRLFVASDETAQNANPVAVLSFDYWKNRLAEAPVIGKSLLINNYPFTVIGVAGPGFRSMVWGHLPDIYVPITMQRVIEPERDYLNDHRSYWLNIAGRLRPNQTGRAAEATINPLFLSLRAAEFLLEHDQSAQAREAFVSRSRLNLDAGAKGFSPMRGDLRTPLIILMGMVLLVAGMAIINVASLLLVRAATRSREFSVRYALGATNQQILRQLLVEGSLLGIAGAAAGLALAPEALRLLIHWMAGRASDSAFTPTLDRRVLVFSIAITLVASLMFSLAPAIQLRNPRLSEALKQQVRTGTGKSISFRRSCVGLQIGFSLLLMIATGLFVRTIQNLRNVNPGFATDHLLTFRLAPELAGYPSNQIAPVEQRVLGALAVLPGVRAVGATDDPDLVDDNKDGDVSVTGYTPRPNEDYTVELPWVSDDYLQTLGIQLAAGRYFSDLDGAAAPQVAIVNERFARHFFGDSQDALGHHISRPERPETDAIIVGVVRDVKHTTVRDRAIPTMYRPFVQLGKPAALTFYVRTWQQPDAAVSTIRGAILNIDSKLIVNDISTMTDQIDTTISNERTLALLATIFGILAALLAGIGLYGILAYSTAQRMQEIGIRVALGAQRSAVVSLIFREVVLLAGAAVAVTIPLALVATRALRSELFNVSTADVTVYSMAILMIALVAVLAGLIPARRAASVDPACALRME